MSIKEKIIKLGEDTCEPSLTISFNTHRTRPDIEQDRLVLKNLLSEAQVQTIGKFGENKCESLLQKISQVLDGINFDQSLESMHIFVSEDTQEIVKTTWPVNQNSIYISNKFALRALIDADSQDIEYLVLVLSQGGAVLYEAKNDSIITEITNEGFPFPETSYTTENNEQASDSEKKDNLVREYFNNVDKALVKICKKSDLKCVVIATEDNYSRLMQVADVPKMYLGYAPIDYNKCQAHEIVKQSWKIIQKFKSEKKDALLTEIELAIPSGNVYTDLNEIYQAAIEGRGDILMVNQEYVQPVKMTSERTFELAEDTKAVDTNGDIVNAISFAVIKNKGKVYFTSAQELVKYGDIVLKTRY